MTMDVYIYTHTHESARTREMIPTNMGGPRAAPSGPNKNTVLTRIRTHYYTRRVKESLTSRFAKLMCAIVISVFFIAALILFILWLSLRPHRPRFYLQSFNLQQQQAYFNLTDENPNHSIGIYYNTAMKATVYHFDNDIGNGTVLNAFYQAPKEVTLINGHVPVLAGDVFSSINGDGVVPLRLEMESVIKFKLSLWDTHNHKMHVSCEFSVGNDGNLLPRYVNQRCPIYF